MTIPFRPHMHEIELQLLGPLEARRGGDVLSLPASRKTRALLGYLAQTRRPHRRDRLCELLWDVPDDPRGALRWSLSKLRSVINVDIDILQADRERVWLDLDKLHIDVVSIAREIEQSDTPTERLRACVDTLDEVLLAGMEVTRQDAFESWLQAEREEMRQLRGRACERIVAHPETPMDVALKYSRLWGELHPYNPGAANDLIRRLNALGLTDEARARSLEMTTRFQRAGIQWQEPEASPVPTFQTNSAATKRDFLERQRISFCTSGDGVKIAHARIGQGPPLVKAANWLNHLELDWDAPIWSPLFRELAREHTFIRYDERGNGLSDWDVSELSFESFVTDLETVVEANQLERFPLLGISQGASVSIEYAIRHPERVSHLILFGAYVAGWRVDASEQEIKEREAIMTLTQSGWGRANPAYRQIFSATFMPTATQDELQWFDQFQKETTSPDNAVRFLSAFGDIDVRHRLDSLDVPTLVLHSRGDQRIPFETGRDIAASIRNAEFVGLDSDNHLLLGREAASQDFVDAIRAFLEVESHG